VVRFVEAPPLSRAFVALVVAILGAGISLAAVTAAARPRLRAVLAAAGAAIYYAGWTDRTVDLPDDRRLHLR
jgi:hypothetical protein